MVSALATSVGVSQSRFSNGANIAASLFLLLRRGIRVRDIATRQDVYGLDLLAWALYLNGDVEAAHREMDRALRLEPAQVPFQAEQAALSYKVEVDGETVELASGRTRGFVNAVLRKVAAAGPPAPTDWPDDATRLSYPDWVVERLTTDLGVVSAADRALIPLLIEAYGRARPGFNTRAPLTVSAMP